MKKNGFSLVEIIVILGALGGIALLVTKMGSSSMNIKNESIVSNDYYDLVRETHFLISNSKACKVSLAGTTFKNSESTQPIKNLELWTPDAKGEKRVKKKFGKDEKFASLQIEDVTLTLDPEGTTGVLKVSVIRPKIRNNIVDIEQSINVNYSIDKASGISTIVDCEEKHEAKESKESDTRTWCGTIQNPCGNEMIQAVAIGRYENGKFTGIFYPTVSTEAKICNGAVNWSANFNLCVSQ